MRRNEGVSGGKRGCDNQEGRNCAVIVGPRVNRLMAVPVNWRVWRALTRDQKLDSRRRSRVEDNPLEGCDPMSKNWQIGRVAQETGLSVHAIRFYEREGLLKAPVRSEGRFRVFDEGGVRDLKFIRKAQELGFILAEIRELLVLRRTSPQACSHVRDLLSKALGRVNEKVKELLRLQSELKGALHRCNRDLKRSGEKAEKSCPVLEELERASGGQVAQAR